MTWHEAHTRWQGIREVLDTIEANGTGALPWSERYEDIFGDRAGLLAALRYRWRLIVEAQLDPDLPAQTLDSTYREITRRNAGLLRVLEQSDAAAQLPNTPREEGSDVVHV